MKALVLERPGDPPLLAWREVPTPSPGPGEVLIQVEACGLCGHDLLVMQGILRRGVPPQPVLGHEVCGRVVALGDDVTSVGLGQQVVPLLTDACGECPRCRTGHEHRCMVGYGIGHRIPGGMAEYLRVRETALVPVPSGLSPEQACLAACPIGVGLKGLWDEVGLKAGESCLVVGAGGGLGTHLVQLARTAKAQVLATTTSEHKVAALEELGADHVLLSPGLDFDDLALALTEEQGAEVVINTLGAPAFNPSLRSLAQFGRLLLLGEVSQQTAGLQVAELLFRDARIIASAGADRGHVEEAVHLVAQGQIRPRVHTTLPMREALEGYRMMRQHEPVGRVVLLPSP